ncbi:siphovirus Gp157 family protein [Sphingobacterium sp. N143]|uniref:siphovirus Gp157 family protein n=1 Tax=Sphingobacterium sp. N143 TaxID=2746727 RepID=UPI002577D221|nr:siphovirus Gp157 family protein [Sphingobacterium sp. N143]MDM1294271.1 siphovirus Gp157 family protein [Sphingobacterium sp. N143]
MGSIFQINQEYLQIASILEENGGELTPELEESLNINRDQLQTKGINYALVIRQLSGESDMIDTEIKRLQALKKSKDNTVDRMKTVVKDAMILHGIESIKGDLINLSIRKVGASVIIDDENKVPESYKVEQPKKLDKKQILDDLKKGLEVSGASMKTDGKSLIIK